MSLVSNCKQCENRHSWQVIDCHRPRLAPDSGLLAGMVAGSKPEMGSGIPPLKPARASPVVALRSGTVALDQSAEMFFLHGAQGTPRLCRMPRRRPLATMPRCCCVG